MTYSIRRWRQRTACIFALAAATLASCGFFTTPGAAVSASERLAVSGRSAAVAVVTGDANSPTSIPIKSVDALLDKAFNRSGQVAVVDAGSRPALHAVILGGHFGNSEAKSAAETQQVGAVDVALNRVVPATPQSDPWASVVEALGWLHSQGGGTLVVENSGLGTAGFLDYRNVGLLEADPAQLVAFARANHELPDGVNVTVVLLGIGWTALPQEPLDVPHRANLVAQWKALLTATGARVTVDETPLTDPGPHPAPPVSPIVITEASWVIPQGECGAQFDSSELHFQVGTATLLDPQIATVALREVVADLRSDRQVADVTGTTSSEGGDALNGPLSLRRAWVVVQLMESIGLPVAQVGRVTGLGSHFPGFVTDTAPDGSLLLGPAAEDRMVRITWPCTSGDPYRPPPQG
jgi:outer membrane protein OmpA-like peptidoglycan-associated protein